MTGRPVEVTDSSFADQVLVSDKPVIVDFRASWCGPCSAVTPVLEQIAAEHGDWVTVALVDVDANPAAAHDYEIHSVPTTVVFRGGRPVKQIFGVKPKAALLAELSDYLA